MRVLVCRYRPRALPRAQETWDEWWKDLGPSPALHAAFWGRSGPPITFEEYRGRYLQEMRAQGERIGQLAARVRAGETVTLLCSSACDAEEKCHRSLLRELVEEAVGR